MPKTSTKNNDKTAKGLGHRVKTRDVLICADWEGKLGWRIAAAPVKRPKSDSERATKEYFVTRDAFLRLDWCQSGATLVVEYAHLHERTPLSVAQVYAADELEILHRNAKSAGIRILAFPQRLSTRARKEASARGLISGTTKEFDPQASYAFIRRHPEVAMKEWRPLNPDDQRIHELLSEIRMDCTLRLNAMRPDYKNADYTQALEALAKATPNISPEARDYFGLSLTRKGTVKKGDLRKTQAATLYVVLFEESGQIRRDESGHSIGLNFIWERVLLSSPYHGGSGTARSNLMFYGLANYDRKSRGEGDDSYLNSDAEDAARRKRWSVWRSFQKELLRALRDVGLAEERVICGAS